MRAFVISGKDDHAVAEAPDPEPGEGQVLVGLAAAGICGSDTQYFSTGRCGDFLIREPFVPGHEASARVLATGSGASSLREGQLVAVNPSRPCYTCSYCKAGRRNLCRNNRFAGSASRMPHAQGYIRDRFVVQASQCVVVSDRVDPGQLALAEPLAVSLHALNRAGSIGGRKVVVAGAGTIGLLIAMAAQHRGAAEVAVSDVHRHALDTALRCGVDRAIDASSADGMVDFVRANSETADVVFEASGAEAALNHGLELAVRGGTIVQVGTLPALTVGAAMNRVMNKELDLLGAFRFDREFDVAVAMLVKNEIDVAPLLTHRYPLEGAIKAFTTACRPDVSTKVQIVSS